MLPIYTFSTLFYDSCKKSKVEANRIEFTNGVMDRLAQAGLGKDYGTYLSKIKKGFNNTNLNDWIWGKSQKSKPPMVRKRATSQPVLPVTTSDSPQSTYPSSPNPFGLADGQSTVIQSVIWKDLGTRAPLSNAPSSAQSMPDTSTNTSLLNPIQPQPQPQQVYQTPSGMPAVPTRPSITETTLSQNGLFKLGQVYDQILQCGFNRDGYVILLQYLLADMIPNQYTNESQCQFNLQFQNFTQSIANQRIYLDPSEQRLWSDKLALTIAFNIFGGHAHQALAQQVEFSGNNRLQIANWLPANLPQW